MYLFGIEPRACGLLQIQTNPIMKAIRKFFEAILLFVCLIASLLFFMVAGRDEMPE